MAAINSPQYLPRNLDSHQFDVILYLITHPKAARIIVTLCDKKSSYLNEIQQVIGGSKTATMEMIKGLDALKIIKSDWKIEQIGGKGGPKTRAVKSYKLNENKEKLIEAYEPFFRKIE